MMNFTVVIPTYNGGELWKESARRLAGQALMPFRVKVIDSSSKDDTQATAQEFNFEIEQIEQKDFDHGGTRSYALADIETELVVFLTQDALLEDEKALSNLVSIFDKDPEVVCAYGRQLPHLDANPLAQHARYNSYKSDSYVTSLKEDFPAGFRKAFLSNSFAAYRVDFLRSIGGFPEHLILGEDAYVAAKALVANKKVAYVSGAKVRHSHNYSVFQEFQRYFDIGVFHSTQSWMIDELGSVEGEGVKFALDQLKYVCKSKKYTWLISSTFTSMAKFIGYKLGKKHSQFGVGLSRKLSMYKSYWNRV
ncbi:rhamnosyltransferase [Marinomonas alcarazii]|uniref:Rhamnosyltransferase n=1 Tax=Marinomonas alcarazii TaxID=491949 RepID=A0A318UWL6_9GAMM|nr:glycosyltransferase [Marinomonas alcarazii]PYF79840.1 rhamnosyltransferase [Marinomonas alcarazii]